MASLSTAKTPSPSKTPSPQRLGIEMTHGLGAPIEEMRGYIQRTNERHEGEPAYLLGRKALSSILEVCSDEMLTVKGLTDRQRGLIQRVLDLMVEGGNVSAKDRDSLDKTLRRLGERVEQADTWILTK